jgi:hypothetical protein
LEIRRFKNRLSFPTPKTTNNAIITGVFCIRTLSFPRFRSHTQIFGNGVALSFVPAFFIHKFGDIFAQNGVAAEIQETYFLSNP